MFCVRCLIIEKKNPDVKKPLESVIKFHKPINKMNYDYNAEMQLKLSPHKTRPVFIPLTIQSAGDRPIIILMKMHQF